MSEDISEYFDYDEMMTLVDNDPEMALMMLQNFLETERDTLNKVVEQASKSDAACIDWQALRKDAHSLKGSSSYLCAKQVSNLSLEMQHAAEAKDKAKVDELLPQLTQHFERAVELMNAKLAELSP